MLTFLDDLKQKVTIGVVGGSNLEKIQQQLGKDGEHYIDTTDCDSRH
jgi:hypothetical protein